VPLARTALAAVIRARRGQVYKHRLFDMYPLNDCDNNKADGDPTCRRKLRVMWHRMPRREARRTRMLYEAAVAGRCHANRKLLDFSYKDD